MALDPRQIIRRPVVSEKSYMLSEKHRAYTFEVHPSANKVQIRQAIEKLFPQARVDRVRILKVRGKPRRVRFARGRTRNWKKAIVYLKEGSTIDVI